ARGYDDVLRALQGAAANYRDGEATSVERISEHVTDELACFVEVEHYRAKVGGRLDVTPVSAGATSVFCPEQGGWKLVHRHADPIPTARPADSVIEHRSAQPLPRRLEPFAATAQYEIERHNERRSADHDHKTATS